jgi:chemotaxis protein MotA
MNIASIIGLVLATVVLWGGLRLSTPDMKLFVDYPSLFIVIGGTFAATAITFQINKIFMLFRIFLKHIFSGSNVDYASLIAEIMKIGDAYRRGESLEAHIGKASDPFLKESLSLVNDGILEKEHLVRILEDRAANMNYLRAEDASKIKVLGQFPPAFGMMGTTIGMIVLLANLGGEDALKTIGPAMGVCLITTLYGVVIANLGFIPIAENLSQATKQSHLKNLIIIEGIKHLLNKANPVVVAEELNSFLPPGSRLDWKEVIGK